MKNELMEHAFDTWACKEREMKIRSVISLGSIERTSFAFHNTSSFYGRNTMDVL